MSDTQTLRIPQDIPYRGLLIMPADSWPTFSKFSTADMSHIGMAVVPVDADLVLYQALRRMDAGCIVLNAAWRLLRDDPSILAGAMITTECCVLVDGDGADAIVEAAMARMDGLRSETKTMDVRQSARDFEIVPGDAA